MFTYLLINIFTLLGPAIFSFEKKIAFVKRWKYALPAILIPGLLFIAWDHVFTIWEIWSFNEQYTIGVSFLQLPLEEWLFFLTVPFAGIFIYECVRFYKPKGLHPKIPLWASVGLILLLTVVLYFNIERTYTAVTALLCLFLLLKRGVIYRSPYMGHFFLSYLITLVPLFIVNGILTALPVVSYDDTQNLGIRLGTIPVEDLFYHMSLYLLNISVYEYVRKKY